MAADEVAPSGSVEAGAAHAGGAADFSGREDPARDERFFFHLQERRARVTWVLLLLIVGMFGLESRWGGSSLTATLVRMGAEVPQLIRAGEWWRLLAPTALHGGFMHLVMNCLVLYYLGPFLERLLGSGRFLILYVISGLLGSLFGTYFWRPAWFALSVGASGALFGLLGATLVLGLWPRGELPAALVRDLKRYALINFGLNLANSLRPNVDFLAHAGGAVAGIVLLAAGLISPTVSLRSRPILPAREAFVRIVATLCAMALLGSIAVAFWKGQPWRLREPLKLERQSLPALHMSLALPTILGPASQVKREDGSLALAFDATLETPIDLRLQVDEHETVEDPNVLRERFAQEVQRLSAPSFYADLRRIGEPKELEVEGYPALAMEFGYARGTASLHLLFQVRKNHNVLLETVSPSGTPPNLEPDLVQILASLREDAER